MWDPGDDAGSQVMYERTGAERWRAAWAPPRIGCGTSGVATCGSRISTAVASAFSARPTASQARCSRSPAETCSMDRRLELERRTVAALAKYALRLGGLAQWRRR